MRGRPGHCSGGQGHPVTVASRAVLSGCPVAFLPGSVMVMAKRPHPQAIPDHCWSGLAESRTDPVLLSCPRAVCGGPCCPWPRQGWRKESLGGQRRAVLSSQRFPEPEWKLFAKGVCSRLGRAPARAAGALLPVTGEKFASGLPGAQSGSRRGPSWVRSTWGLQNSLFLKPGWPGPIYPV